MTNNVLSFCVKQKGHTMEPLFYLVIKVQKPPQAVYIYYNNTYIYAFVSFIDLYAMDSTPMRAESVLLERPYPSGLI